MYIFDAIRTARGALRDGGAFTAVKPMDLLAQTIDHMMSRHDPDLTVSGMKVGCVSQSGEQGGHIGRMAQLLSTMDNHIPTMTLNNFCCSSLSAMGQAALQAEFRDALYFAGGVENMSRVAPFSDGGPYYSDMATMPKTGFVPLWFAADFVATLNGISRKEVDDYAVTSQARAIANLAHKDRLVPINTPTGVISQDELPRQGVSSDKIATMPTMAEKLGPAIADRAFLAAYSAYSEVCHVHTFANAPALADAASIGLVGSENAGKAHGLKPLAKIIAYTEVADNNLLSLTGGITAAEQALKQANMRSTDVDLVEFNEAYAAVCLHFMRRLNIDHSQMNIAGGAIALGHPMGATGVILITSLLENLQRENKQTGMIAISGASGLGTAMIIERLS